MIDKATKGSLKYFLLLGSLISLIVVGAVAYLIQLKEGLGITGMSRDISWGLYIAQFTFFVGIAASAVTVVTPYYLHNHTAFRKILILGEILAIASIVMALIFIVVDLGKPFRLINIPLHPSPKSPIFWDTIVLPIYLLINLAISRFSIKSEQHNQKLPWWVKGLIYLSIPVAISIHTVTALIYSGLPGRHMWLSAIVTARFLASAFAAGPSLLIILSYIVKRNTSFDPGKDAFFALGKIIAYALTAHLLFITLEIFTSYYSGIPSHIHSIKYLFFGLDGYHALVIPIRASIIMAFAALILLIIPKTRKKLSVLVFSSALVFIAALIDKGIGFTVGGFIPNPMGKITEYLPSIYELLISAGIMAIGLSIITILFKVVVSVRQDMD